MSHPDRIGQLVRGHRYRMLTDARRRQLRPGRQLRLGRQLRPGRQPRDLAGTARRAQRAGRPMTRSLIRGCRPASLVKLAAAASSQSRPGGAP